MHLVSFSLWLFKILLSCSLTSCFSESQTFDVRFLNTAPKLINIENLCGYNWHFYLDTIVSEIMRTRQRFVFRVATKLIAFEEELTTVSFGAKYVKDEVNIYIVNKESALGGGHPLFDNLRRRNRVGDMNVIISREDVAPICHQEYFAIILGPTYLVVHNGSSTVQTKLYCPNVSNQVPWIQVESIESSLFLSHFCTKTLNGSKGLVLMNDAKPELYECQSQGDLDKERALGQCSRISFLWHLLSTKFGFAPAFSPLPNTESIKWRTIPTLLYLETKLDMSLEESEKFIDIVLEENSFLRPSPDKVKALKRKLLYKIVTSNQVMRSTVLYHEEKVVLFYCQLRKDTKEEKEIFAPWIRPFSRSCWIAFLLCVVLVAGYESRNDWRNLIFEIIQVTSVLMKQCPLKKSRYFVIVLVSFGIVLVTAYETFITSELSTPPRRYIFASLGQILEAGYNISRRVNPTQALGHGKTAEFGRELIRIKELEKYFKQRGLKDRYFNSRAQLVETNDGIESVAQGFWQNTSHRAPYIETAFVVTLEEAHILHAHVLQFRNDIICSTALQPLQPDKQYYEFTNRFHQIFARYVERLKEMGIMLVRERLSRNQASLQNRKRLRMMKIKTSSLTGTDRAGGTPISFRNSKLIACVYLSLYILLGSLLCFLWENRRALIKAVVTVWRNVRFLLALLFISTWRSPVWNFAKSIMT